MASTLFSFISQLKFYTFSTTSLLPVIAYGYFLCYWLLYLMSGLMVPLYIIGLIQLVFP